MTIHVIDVSLGIRRYIQDILMSFTVIHHHVKNFFFQPLYPKHSI